MDLNKEIPPKARTGANHVKIPIPISTTFADIQAGMATQQNSMDIICKKQNGYTEKIKTLSAGNSLINLVRRRLLN